MPRWGHRPQYRGGWSWEPTAYSREMVRPRGKRKAFGLKRQRGMYSIRTRASGVFVNLPSPALPDGVWGRQLDEELARARKVLVEFRDKVRGGKTLLEIAEEQRREEEAVYERVLDRVFEGMGKR